MRRVQFIRELWYFDDPPAWLIVLLAIAASMLAFSARFALDPWLGNRQPFTPAFAAVAVAGWMGGWRSGLLAALFCHAWANYFFVEPRHTFNFSEQEFVGAASYYLIAAVILLLGHNATSANKNLRAAMKGLHKVDERRAHFLAVLGHELRNPLAAMRTAVDLLGLARGDARLQAQAEQVLDRQLNQMSVLIDDLLDISRIDQGKVELQRKPVSLDDLLSDAARSARSFTDPRRQQVRIEIEGQIGEALVDSTRLLQVLSNLLHNASKFSPEGGSITLSGRREDGWCQIIVRDWGEGIDGERLKDVFEPFVQIDERKHRNDGLGLGLAVVKGLITLHGGRIEARSHGVGKGTEMIVSLPAS